MTIEAVRKRGRFQFRGAGSDSSPLTTLLVSGYIWADPGMIPPGSAAR